MSATPTVTLPATERFYIIHNALGGTYGITFSNGSATVSVAANITTALIWQTGSVLYGIDLATGTDVATVAPQITNNNLQTVAGQISPTNNLGTVAGISANVTTVAGVSGNVTTVAGISSNVTTVAGISSAVSGVNAIASNVTAVNTDPLKTNITNVSGNATNINAVAGNATNINTVAGISSNVTTVAGISAAVSGVNAIASDVTGVNNIASNVTTVAGNNANVTTVAGISSNVTTVAGVSSNVTTVAGISSAVSTVATNVADVNNFADLYQIASSPPATDGGGNALSQGDLFFDTSASELKIFNGSAFQGGVTATGNLLAKSSNLSDLASATTARTNLGLDPLLAAKAPLASPNFSGTPQIGGVNIATTASIPAGGNTVDMVASGTLANGDTVILNADGTVSAVSGVAGGALSTQTFQSSSSYIGSKGTFHSGENKVLMVYRDSGNSSHGKIVAGTVSGNTLSFGTPETFHGQYTNDFDVAYDVNANLVVVAFESTSSQYGEVRTYSLSGTTFTAQGSPTRWDGTNSSGTTRIQYDPDAQSCVLFWRAISSSNYGKARNVTVSGSNISFGSTITFESNLVTKIEVTYNTTENHHLAIYNRTSGGSTRQAYATVTLSGTTVTNQSSAVIFGSDTIGDVDLAYNPTINKVAISCNAQSLNPIAGYIVVGTPSTHAYSWGSPPSPNSAAGLSKRFSGTNVVDMTKITYNPDTGKFIVIYRDTTDSFKGKGVDITIDSSSNVTVGTTETFFDFNAYYFAPIYDTNADKLVVGYTDLSDNNFGKSAIILFSSSTLTASNFLGFSNAAYTNGQTATIQVTGNVDDAQSGLTINTTYYVQNDGTLGTSPSAIASVTAGKAIAATKILIA